MSVRDFRGVILAEPEKKQNFWTTLPGLLTGIAAVLTAVTGLLVVMYPHGFAGSKDGRPAAVSPQDASVAAAKGAGESPTHASETGRQETGREGKPTVLVVGKDGTESRLSLNSFRDSYSGEAIQLKNGQAIQFDKIRSVDFLETHDYEQEVRVTLMDGRAVEGAIMSGEQMTGDSDIGPFSISVKSLKRILFER
jgi:hypothetical protein